jgi:hypothetical protein
MKYLVIKEVSLTPVSREKQYLVAISYDPYNRGNGEVLTVCEKDDAFVFSTIEAAEMAAVWVGGEVVALSKGGN